MRIKAFHVKDGDCLLIQGVDGTLILADGGRAGAFEEHVMPVLHTLESDIDLVYVSHIDNDHISGILKLIETEIAWRVHDFRSRDSEFSGRPPKLDRLRRFHQIWHNGFAELIDDQDGKIHSALEFATQTLALSPNQTELFELYDNLTTGVADALALNYRLQYTHMDAMLNEQSERKDKLMVLSEANETYQVGGFKILLLGPTVEDLENLRKDWNAWISEKGPDIRKIQREAKEAAGPLGLSEDEAMLHLMLKEAEKLGEGEGQVSEPNIASLTLLLDNGHHTVLMTGDARSKELLAGLKQHGLISDEQGIHVDVLKVQHHGAAGNVTDQFCKSVTADHYIFCANGAHTNPEWVVLDGILKYRLGEEASQSISPGIGRPFTFWFTTHSETPEITGGQKKFLGKIESRLSKTWPESEQFKRVYPDPGVDPFSLTIELQ
jgi:beta-lactamase superfamily II metal-dependent hydrolase